MPICNGLFNGITSPTIGIFGANKISFTDENTVSDNINFNGLFSIDQTINHVNFIAFLAKITKTRTEYKFKTNELVLVVISQTKSLNQSSEIDPINNPTNCIWDVFQLQGRPLVK